LKICDDFNQSPFLVLHQYHFRFCSSEEGDSSSYEPLPNQNSCSYRVRLEDIGRCLKCECVVTDVFGRSGEVVYTETTPVMPGDCFDYISILALPLYSFWCI